MCDYTGNDFGAHYPDACCIDGYLWDLDSDDGEGMLTSGGEISCPKCSTAEYLDDAKDDSQNTSWGRHMTSLYSGAMIIEGALRKCHDLNPAATQSWMAANPVIATFDWPDRAGVLSGEKSPETAVETDLVLSSSLKELQSNSPSLIRG